MFKKLKDSFQNTDLICDVAEFHGTMCGMLIGNISLSFEKWLKEMIEFRIGGHVLSSQQLELLSSLFWDSSMYLRTGNLDFNLLLPDDKTSYAERVHSLSEWCAGFVYGLGVNRFVKRSKLDEQNQVFINTVTELSSGIESEANEDDEKAYVQIVEYLCVGTLTLFDDVYAANKKSARPEHE